MHVLQLILESGTELKVFGLLEELRPLKEGIEQNSGSTDFLELTASLSVKVSTICAIELFDVSEGVIQDEN